MYQIYSRDYNELAHFYFKSSLVIFGTIHKSQNIPQHKVSSKKLSNEKKHNLNQFINKIYPITPRSVYRVPISLLKLLYKYKYSMQKHKTQICPSEFLNYSKPNINLPFHEIHFCTSSLTMAPKPTFLPLKLNRLLRPKLKTMKKTQFYCLAALHLKRPNLYNTP